MIIIWIIAIIIFLGVFAVFVNILKNWRTRLNIKKFSIFFVLGVSFLTLLLYYFASSYWVIFMGYGFVLLFSVLLASSKKIDKIS